MSLAAPPLIKTSSTRKPLRLAGHSATTAKPRMPLRLAGLKKRKTVPPSSPVRLAVTLEGRMSRPRVLLRLAEQGEALSKTR